MQGVGSWLTAALHSQKSTNTFWNSSPHLMELLCIHNSTSTDPANHGLQHCSLYYWKKSACKWTHAVQSCDLNLSPSDFKAYSLPIASICLRVLGTFVFIWFWLYKILILMNHTINWGEIRWTNTYKLHNRNKKINKGKFRKTRKTT